MNNYIELANSLSSGLVHWFAEKIFDIWPGYSGGESWKWKGLNLDIILFSKIFVPLHSILTVSP